MAIASEVLKEEGLEDYGVHIYVPLRMLLRDPSLLETERERQYALNSLTHVALLIFEKMGRSIVAVIEVDGWPFHKDDSAQAERDAHKTPSASVTAYLFSVSAPPVRAKRKDCAFCGILVPSPSNDLFSQFEQVALFRMDADDHRRRAGVSFFLHSVPFF
ncbi:MAG: hypothetical protein IJE96_09115 [Mailhella sp.]|nr:hypothetical protein [Mailhella sp.]